MTRLRHLQLVASNGETREDTCHHFNGHLPTLEDFRVDVAEDLFLKLFRHICASIAGETAHGWLAARRIAEAELGVQDGWTLINDISTLLHAIKVERAGRFSFMAADCPVCRRRVCEEEQIILELMRAARRRDSAAIADHARALAGGGEATRLILAAKALGPQLGERA